MHRTRGKPISREDLRAGTTVWLKVKICAPNDSYAIQTCLVDIIRVDRENNIMELKKHNLPMCFTVPLDSYSINDDCYYLCYTDE